MKKINFLIIFFISHKSCVKIFLKLIVNNCFKGTCQHNPCYISESKIDSNNGFFFWQMMNLTILG